MSEIEKPPKRQRNAISAANYIDWSRQAQSFDAMAAETGGAMSYTGNREPRSLATDFVSAAYFKVFGVQAALGRTFATGEDRTGSPKVVVLTHRIWMSQFAGDTMLFATSPLDAANLMAVGALLLVVALAACLVPAWRAARADPISALRQE